MHRLDFIQPCARRRFDRDWAILAVAAVTELQTSRR